jgi:hypothetical protein
VSSRALNHPRRGPGARAFFFAAVLLLSGCANSPKGEVSIRPSPQRQATHQVVGDTVVASLGGASVTVRWLTATAVEQYFERKPGLVYPWPKEVWKVAPLTVFLLRVHNQTPDDIQFDPTLASLVSQDGRHERPVSYEEMYQRLEGTEGSDARLQSLQATLLSRFVVIPPGGQREGLLAFPTLDPEDKHLLLEFASFFVGGRNVLGLFEFQVLRQQTE